MSTDALNGGDDFSFMDPQRIYTAEDSAFFGATLMRSLTAYRYSSDPLEATTVVADAATDTGRPNADFTEWQFTVRDGMKWQDGSAVSCEDFKFGVARTFAVNDISGGPAYAIQYLAIPGDAPDGSDYLGPFDGTGQDLFDQAVTCVGNTITFKLNQSVPDFNQTVTLGFGAVPNPSDHPDVDTGEAYGAFGNAVWSDGPYVVDSYTTGAGGKMVLKRNPYWSNAADSYRVAYPDEWQVEFALDPDEVDRRLMRNEGEDQYAVAYSPIERQNVGDIFVGPKIVDPAYAGRAIDAYNGVARYMWIKTDQVPNLKVRQAMMAALDREAFRSVTGDAYGLEFADGLIAPNIGADYAPTHIWDASGPLGAAVPSIGNSALARQLLAESGEESPEVEFIYGTTVSYAQDEAATVRASLKAAGFKVNLFGMPSSGYSWIWQVGDFGSLRYGADWSDAGTVISPLLQSESDFLYSYDLSHVGKSNFPDYQDAIADALATAVGPERSAKWQALNTEAVNQAFVIPLFYEREQHLAGAGVGNLYRWAPYASWPYAQLYAAP